MNIGFIGCGNMAKAIIHGIIKGNIFEKESIFASDTNKEALLAFCAQTGIIAAENNLNLAEKADIIVLSIKPQTFPLVLPQIKESVQGKLIISIAAGKTVSYIEEQLSKVKIIRVMPNLNAQIGCSETAVCGNALCQKEDFLLAKKIFENIGNVYELEESAFSAFSACACCSPAFSFMYINALAQGAIACGLDETTAYNSAVSSVIGSAKLLADSPLSPQELIERVCSPGGTTIEGVQKLRENAFEEVVMAAVKASFEKDKLL